MSFLLFADIAIQLFQLGCKSVTLFRLLLYHPKKFVIFLPKEGDFVHKAAVLFYFLGLTLAKQLVAELHAYLCEVLRHEDKQPSHCIIPFRFEDIRRASHQLLLLQVKLSFYLSLLSLFGACAKRVLADLIRRRRRCDRGSKLGDIRVHFFKEVDDTGIAIFSKRLMHNGDYINIQQPSLTFAAYRLRNRNPSDKRKWWFDCDFSPQRAQQQSNYNIHITMQGQSKSLLNNNLAFKPDHSSERRTFKIFMTDSQGKINHITLHLASLSVLEVILVSIGKFAELLPEGVNQNGEDYQLFIARKNGGKNEDYPSLESHQPIHKFGYHKFYLEERHTLKLIKHIHSISTMKSLPAIHTHFKHGKPIENVEKDDERPYWGCFWKK